MAEAAASQPANDQTQSGNLDTQTANKLQELVDRGVHLEEERANLAEDLKELYKEAENQGFDKKAVKQLVRETRMDSDKRQEQQQYESILDTYRSVIGIAG